MKHTNVLYQIEKEIHLKLILIKAFINVWWSFTVETPEAFHVHQESEKNAENIVTFLLNTGIFLQFIVYKKRGSPD